MPTRSPRSADTAVPEETAAPTPMSAGHRDWEPLRDPALAAAAFGPRADRLLLEATALASGRQRMGGVVVTGDDSGWAAASLAALLPQRKVVLVIAADGARPSWCPTRCRTMPIASLTT